MSLLQPTAMAAMPRLTSYSAPQVPPSTPLVEANSSLFDAGLPTVSSKAIGIRKLETIIAKSNSPNGLVSIQVLSQTTARPVSGLLATLTAVQTVPEAYPQGDLPAPSFMGITDVTGRISNWQAQDESMQELVDGWKHGPAGSEWLWVLTLMTGKYWTSVGLKTTVPEVTVRLPAYPLTIDRQHPHRHVMIHLGQHGFTTEEGDK